MDYKQTTQVPNFLLDNFLVHLTESEIKVALIVIRQTLGWINVKTGKRKTRDRMSINQLVRKTGVSKRSVTSSIQSLIAKQLICVSDFKGNALNQPHARKGKRFLFFSFNNSVQKKTETNAKKAAAPVQKTYYNKTNISKLTCSKASHGFSGHISTLLVKATSGTLSNRT